MQIPRRWTRESCVTFARRYLSEGEFTRSDVCRRCRAIGWHWSNGQGVLAALERHGLVERRAAIMNHGTGRTLLMFRFVDPDAVDLQREQDVHEAQVLMRIAAPREPAPDPRIDELRQAFQD